jgi:cytosine/adenosine deaminase-related metal-dependent hydrolase
MERQLEGTVIRGESLEPVEGRVVVSDGRIEAVEAAPTDSTDVICPAFVNAHTHLGDSIAKEAGEGLSLDELVAPPDGLKHRLLRAASREGTAAAMARSLRFMRATGTGAFVEFREGGVEGVETIRDALALVADRGASGNGSGEGGDGASTWSPAVDGELRPVILGRETADAMRVSDGFGASGARDADFAELRAATREAGKTFGIHAGERDPDDVDAALALEPDFLVHMTNATTEQLDRTGDAGLPVVCCPRSNLVTDVGVPPLAALAERTTVALGTDNAMLDSPSMFRELAFAAKLSGLPAPDVLRMATVDAAAVAGLDCGAIEPGREARLLVLDGDSDNLAGVRDVVRAIVRRAGASDVRRVLLPRGEPTRD